MGDHEPVDAVIATASTALTYFLRSVLMISRRRTDLPVPLEYKKKVRFVGSVVGSEVIVLCVYTDQHCQCKICFAHPLPVEGSDFVLDSGTRLVIWDSWQAKWMMSKLRT
jgi:hypothetical protein